MCFMLKRKNAHISQPCKIQGRLLIVFCETILDKPPVSWLYNAL